MVSRANGANNSTWVSDIGIFNPSTVAVTVTIRIWVTTGVLIKTVNINAGGQIVITDIVGWFNPGLYTSAAISIVSTQTLIITSRTYNQLAAGIICFPTGTLGQGLSGFLTTGGISIGQSGWVPNLLEYSGFRSNIGYTNTGTTNATLTVRLYNGNGVQVGTYNVISRPGPVETVQPALPECRRPDEYEGRFRQDHRQQRQRRGRLRFGDRQHHQRPDDDSFLSITEIRLVKLTAPGFAPGAVSLISNPWAGKH